ncbi:MAG: alpha/beta fold hydrolase [Spirochaetota bacterium]
MERPFTISQDIYPFDSKWMEIEKIPVHFIDEGQGPTILFCHGNPSWSLLYSGIIQNLRDTFRCIAMDLPGFGMSGKPTYPGYGYTPAEHSRILTSFVEKMGLDKFSIFVQDWGGPIGLGMAGKIPNKIEKLIIGNTWAWPHQDNGGESYEAAKAFSDKMGGPEAKARIMEKNTFLKISINMLTIGMAKRNPALKSQVKDAYLAPFATPESRIPTWVFPGQIIQGTKFLAEVRDNLVSLLPKPTLLFWGLKDTVFPPAVLELWKSKLKDYKLVELPEANHFFQEEEPEWIAKEMREFL